MSPLAYLAIYGWIPFVLYLYKRVPAQKAVVISFIIAWLFLPQFNIVLPGIPDLTKASATAYGILLATIVFDVKRLSAYRFAWIDIPIVIFCLCPIVTALSNGLGVYDGVSMIMLQIVTWGIPYFLGRIYLADLTGARQLAVGIFLGGLAYVPFCLYEVRMSPQLHLMIYGFRAHQDFSQTIRWGGFRPTVFMIHGLAVAAFMMAASLIGLWLWKSGTIKKINDIPMRWLAIALVVTFILCKSTGAYFLLFLGIALLYLCSQLRTTVPVLLLAVAMVVYLFISSQTDAYVTDQAVEGLSNLLPPDRIQSLEFRFNNEEVLSDIAREKPIFGWGGWGRSLLYDDDGKLITVPDSLWIIEYGEKGAVGLTSMMALLLLPPLTVLTQRCPPKLWMRPEYAPLAALSITVMMYTIECLLNAMINPIYILACGSLSGIALRPVVPQAKRRQVAMPPNLSPQSYSRLS
ncbi:MAG: O-antigen ligase domain-containing protein [Elainellaceae cyanobacterium]